MLNSSILSQRSISQILWKILSEDPSVLLLFMENFHILSIFENPGQRFVNLSPWLSLKSSFVSFIGCLFFHSYLFVCDRATNCTGFWTCLGLILCIVLGVKFSYIFFILPTSPHPHPFFFLLSPSEYSKRVKSSEWVYRYWSLSILKYLYIDVLLAEWNNLPLWNNLHASYSLHIALTLCELFLQSKVSAVRILFRPLLEDVVGGSKTANSLLFLKLKISYTLF